MPQYPAFLNVHSRRTMETERAEQFVEVSVDPIMHSDNIAALHHAALDGRGIAILASFVANADLATGRLVPVMEGYQPISSTVSIIYPRAPIVPRKVRAFIDFMTTEFIQIT
ncbi:LysR substrate-binding domain-containing protein [Phyllobacterium sp. CCNWLW11]|uniref:LysR substrate-binding domain-containing protein n=1 Tax=Phyllobacterium sp. CCNWLW11 TaxID=3126384 RepID=UPI0030130E32